MVSNIAQLSLSVPTVIRIRVLKLDEMLAKKLTCTREAVHAIR